MIVVTLLFMEWRSALLVALSIPITVAMTLGMCALLGVDIQQISIAALIIALGLLVDDPVVAGDAINRGAGARHAPRRGGLARSPEARPRDPLRHAHEHRRVLALAPGRRRRAGVHPIAADRRDRLAGGQPDRLDDLLIPLLGYYMLRGQKGLESGLDDGGKGSRFARIYNGFSELCMEHKWAAWPRASVLLFTALSLVPKIGTNFFPKDLHNTFTVNLFLPEGTPIRQTKAEALRAIAAIDKLAGSEAEAYTTFVGAGTSVLALGGPRAAGVELRPDPGPHPRRVRHRGRWRRG